MKKSYLNEAIQKLRQSISLIEDSIATMEKWDYQSILSIELKINRIKKLLKANSK